MPTSQASNTHMVRPKSETTFRRLTQRPPLAIPTVCLMLAALSILSMSIYSYTYWDLPSWFVICTNTVAMYFLYTVVHEALHRTISTSSSVNEWMGRIALFILQPLLSLSYCRLLHNQHHRFTNTSKDPEFTLDDQKKPLTQWLKWMCLGLTFFPKPIKVFRKVIDTKEVLGNVTLSGLMVILCLIYNVWLEVFVIWFIPSRLALLLTLFVFSYLPHNTRFSVQHSCKPKDPHHILSALSLCQNYHTVHHVYPAIPFYRYHSVWLARLDYLQKLEKGNKHFNLQQRNYQSFEHIPVHLKD